MFHGIEASYVSIQDIGTGLFSYFTDTETSIFYDTELAPYIEKLSFDPERDLIMSGSSVCIRFTYPVSFPGTVDYSPQKNPDGSPGWTTRPPAEIGAFLVGVGYARRQQRLSDTIMRSIESAAAVLVSQVSANITAREITVDHASATFFHQESRGILMNFLVLETWLDPVTQDVWTLVIAE